MKIEKPGFYRTRDGQKAEVAAIHKSTLVHFCCVGWLSKAATSWTRYGMCHPTIQSPIDIVSEWIEPVPWDWSTTPPWLNVMHQGPYGNWRLFKEVPLIHNGNFSIPDAGIEVPKEYAPKWSGDWKQSLTVRPGYKENSK